MPSTSASNVPQHPPAEGVADSAAGGPRAVVEADFQAYLNRCATTDSMSSSAKWKLGLLSAVAFVALAALIWDWTFALFALAIFALHEGGHYLAMKLTGYKNLGVFFVPGLGAVAIGEKQDATVAQKVFVYLAGPVPGIVLATAGLVGLSYDALPIITDDVIIIENYIIFLMIMLVINVANLVPVTPLDGGRVMEVLLFSRWPGLRFAFTAVSCVALLAAGVLLPEPGALILGILVAFMLPAQRRYLRLEREVARPSAALGEQAAARRVFSALSHEPFRKWDFKERATAADALIAELRTPVPGIVGIATGIAIYGACFAAPMLAAWSTSPVLREIIPKLWE